MSDYVPPTIHQLLDAFEREIQAARDELSRPKGGMRVPFFGEFARVPPSGLNRLDWWARAFREALGVKP